MMIGQVIISIHFCHLKVHNFCKYTRSSYAIISYSYSHSITQTVVYMQWKLLYSIKHWQIAAQNILQKKHWLIGCFAQQINWDKNCWITHWWAGHTPLLCRANTIGHDQISRGCSGHKTKGLAKPALPVAWVTIRLNNICAEAIQASIYPGITHHHNIWT